jgi:hypothetical protein
MLLLLSMLPLLAVALLVTCIAAIIVIGVLAVLAALPAFLLLAISSGRTPALSPPAAIGEQSGWLRGSARRLRQPVPLHLTTGWGTVGRAVGATARRGVDLERRAM